MSRFRRNDLLASARNARRGILICYVFSLVAVAGCARVDSSSPPTAVATTEPTKTLAKNSAKSDALASPDLSDHAPDDIFEVVDSAPNFELVGHSQVPNILNATTYVAEAPIDQVQVTSFLISVSADATRDRSTTFKLPPGFAVGANSELIDGMPSRLRCDVDGSEFALIPEGAFQMGSNDGPANAQPIVQMLADAFYISVTEIRVGQYADARRRVAGKGQLLSEPINSSSPVDHPVLGVQWIDAKNYAASIGCDLPTEAQWEKAARGQAGYSCPWGNSRPLWTAPRTLDQIDAVASHAEDRSVYGAFDLAGNAWEWTSDLYQEDAFKSLFQIPLERRRNWTGPKSSSGTSQRVVKGGGLNWTVYARRGIKVNDRHPQVGFRCVLNLISK